MHSAAHKLLTPHHATSCSSSAIRTRSSLTVRCGFKFVNKNAKKASGGFNSKPSQPPQAPAQQHSKKFQELVDRVQNGGRPQPKAQELASHTSEERWRELDAKLNKYPMQRTFTAIGEGGDALQAAMVEAVEKVVGAGQVTADLVATRPSSGDRYLSVKIGPVTVNSPDQVIAIFSAMKADTRVKWTA